ncbi:DUF2189 domain-containing protein [Roseospirillum parvum]|uniref:Uncharacterized membrane protein n=1 Tax=Roseospirillum parvum TaxID=83401 RepID=A0A1G8FMP2_9PROT|nr:DUF2189 domain-containing protein [Roseospirillum parvum]SDH83414.1 Uncharacterized membrane protein [Roseospirillum parvum]
MTTTPETPSGPPPPGGPLPHAHPGSPLPHAHRVREVGSEAPFLWLAAGWRDLARAPVLSLAWGALFTGGGLGIFAALWGLDMLYLLSPLIGGFLLVGPLLTLGLYDISRCLERGERPSLKSAVTAWRDNPFHVMTCGLLLMLVMLTWVRLAVIVYALFYPYDTIDMGNLWAAMTTPVGLGFAATSMALGGAVAAGVFVCGVVALPMLRDRRVDPFQAALVSLLAVLHNPGPMLLWAGLIALFTVGGLLTGFLGLIVTLPLIGHASWHAYRALVPDPPGVIAGRSVED